MSWLTRVMAALLRCSARLLPADRRVWARALWAEADDAMLPCNSGLEHWAAGHIGQWAPVASRGESLYGYGQDPRLDYVAGNARLGQAFASRTGVADVLPAAQASRRTTLRRH